MSDLKLILIIEDNPDDELLMLDALRQGGVQTEIALARDGQQALDYLFGTGRDANHKADRKPDLVLLDLKLPKIGGHEILRRIRSGRNTRYIPIVILTSSSEESDIIESYDNGANSYVRKPIEYGKFVDAVRALRTCWLEYNEAP